MKELEAQREATQTLLSEDVKVELALERPQYTDDGVGGRVKSSSQTLAPQIFYIAGPAGNQSFPEQQAMSGEVSVYNIILLAAHDADVQDGDLFTHKGVDYEVDFVYPDREYRTMIRVKHGV